MYTLRYCLIHIKFMYFQVFYSVALTDGRMNAWFGTGTGKEVTKLKSTDRFDDGKVHSLSINRNDKK